MRKFLILFLLSSFFIFGQSNEDLFSKANALYKVSKFKEAVSLYSEIEASGLTSSELQYNLANCYYKLNEVAQAVYHYEKALKLNPSNIDAKTNLVFANRLTLDRVAVLPKPMLTRFSDSFLSVFTYNEWAIFVIVFTILGSILFLLYYLSVISSRKRLFFIGSLVSFLLMIFTAFVSYHRFNKEVNKIEAIVFEKKVSVKNEPLEVADESFVVHQGLKVSIEDTVDDWVKIKLTDGKIGWLKAVSVKEL